METDQNGPTPSTPSRLHSQLSHPSQYSTPSTRRGSSDPEEYSEKRGKDLFHSICKSGKVWVEQPNDSTMMAQYLERIDEKYRAVVEKMNKLPSLKTFISTIGKGKSNEDEFAQLASDIYALLLSSSIPLPKPDIRYVYSGQYPMRHRTAAHPWITGHESSSNRFGLKPDFFTAWVREHEGQHEPASLSARLYGNKATLPRRSDRLGANKASPEIIRNDKGVFAWDDINVLLEIKSVWNAKNEQDILSNLVLKATEVFRFQWQRRYVLGILICGSKVRIVRCERSGVFLGQVLEAKDTLVKCILASFIPGDSGITPPKEPMFVQLDDGTVRLEVQVGGDKFILGDQIVGPQRDHLVGRATAVHRARRHTDTTWTCCFKTAWPYAVRPHEGEVLETLQGVTGVVRLFGWDAPKTEGDLDAHHIHRDYKLLDISSKSPLKTLTASGDVDIDTATMAEALKTDGLSKSPLKTLTAGGDVDIDTATMAEALKTDGLNCFNSRQYRQTVTEYINDSFDTFRFHGPIDRLYAWLGLYKAVNAIAVNGFVHRDLSWSNVRLFRPQQDSPPSVTIIDFDLASIIEGSSSGSPDKTGTVTFMPIEVLISPSGRAFRHQELHEDESVFWIGFLAIINCSKSGREVVNNIAHQSSLEAVGSLKFLMLARSWQKIHWPSWFAPQEDANTIIRDLCLQLIELQFESTGYLDVIYPDVGDKDENGVRRQKTRHERVFQNIVEEFEKRIGQVKKLQGIGGAQVEWLTEGTQSLQM